MACIPTTFIAHLKCGNLSPCSTTPSDAPSNSFPLTSQCDCLKKTCNQIMYFPCIKPSNGFSLHLEQTTAFGTASGSLQPLGLLPPTLPPSLPPPHPPPPPCQCCKGTCTHLHPSYVSDFPSPASPHDLPQSACSTGTQILGRVFHWIFSLLSNHRCSRGCPPSPWIRKWFVEMTHVRLHVRESHGLWFGFVC